MATAVTQTQLPGTAAEPPRIALNGPAPDFEASSTHGPLKLSEYAKGSWLLLFSHPADFTPVCTTEFVEFARLAPELERRGVKLLGLSVDSVYSHIAWLRNIQEKFGVEIGFPVVADLDQRISRLYGMIHEPSSVTATVRCVFFVDPKLIVRAMIYYPMQVGRSFGEILRVLDALQTVDREQVACPANWQPGQDVIVPAPVTTKAAEERTRAKNLELKDWYFAQKHL